MPSVPFPPHVLQLLSSPLPPVTIVPDWTLRNSADLNEALEAGHTEH